MGSNPPVYAATRAPSPADLTSDNYYDPGSPVYQEIWVDPGNGDDTTHNGASPSAAFRTLARAWQSVPTTDPLVQAVRINLQPGTYTAEMLPNYWETRYGTASAPIMIRGNGSSRADVILQNTVNMYDVHYVYFENLSIVLHGDTFHCELCDHILLRNSVFTGGAQQAQETLKFNQSQYIYLENNDISGAWDNAIDFVGVQYGHILNNQIHNAGDWCAYAKGGSAYLRVESNTIYDCGTGGFTAGQGTGFQFMTPPWIQYEAYDIKVVNNLIHDIEGAGLGVNGGYNVLMAYNTMYRVGSRDHLIEVVFGGRSCDGSPGDEGRERCLQFLNQGGWGTTVVDDGNNYIHIPNKNVFIYNNVIYNPSGVQSLWQHFAIYDPRNNPASSHIPTAVTDDNLRISGNVIWNGDATMPLGIEGNSQACIDNPTCNATQLNGENYINIVQPQFIDAALNDFHLAGSWSDAVATFSIPDFPTWEIPSVAAGSISNEVLIDFDGAPRAASNPPGAYASGSSLAVSVQRGNPSPSNSSTVPFIITFSSPVTGVSTTAPFDDFSVVSGLRAFITSVTSQTTSIYVVNVNTGSGDGAVQLNVLDSGGIEDADHNGLHGTNTSGQTYTIDRSSPTVSFIVRGQPNPTNALNVAFTVLFSEPVTGVSSEDFSVASNGVVGATISNVTGSGATRTVSVNTGSGDGTLRLDVSTGASITDTAGNALSVGYSAGEAYTLQNSAPILLTPADASTITSFRPTFDWVDAFGASGYTIQVSKSISFNSSLLNKNITSSTYTPSASLPANAIFYWRVRSKIGKVYGSWSRQPLRFITPPAAPTLVSPGKDALLVGTSPLLTWSAAALPSSPVFDSYQAQIATDINFLHLVHDRVDSGISSTQDASVVLPLTGATYYWRVRAVSASDSSFISPWSLVRKMMIKYSPPVLSEPSDMSTAVGNLPTFVWALANGAKNYTVEIAQNPSFAGKISKTVNSARYTPTTPLTTGVRYYWRVKINGNYTPITSTAWSFIP
jgi:hypothetical protein